MRKDLSNVYTRRPPTSRPVIVEDNWTVLQSATETEPPDEARVLLRRAAGRHGRAVLFPLSVWKAHEALLAGRDKAITGV